MRPRVTQRLRGTRGFSACVPARATIHSVPLFDSPDAETSPTEPDQPRPWWPQLALLAIPLAFAVWWLIPASPSKEPPVPAREARPTAEPARPAPTPRAEPAAPAPVRRRARAPEADEVPTPPPEPVTPLVSLVVESDIPGASVFVDRIYKGTTPITLEDVAPGQRHLNVSVEGYDGYAESLDVEPGTRTVTVRFKQVRLSESVAVVHKHRFGECRGMLAASARGIRYETTDDDAFSVALGNLEQFEVDYLESNLRLKPRGGCTYNFTDDGGGRGRALAVPRLCPLKTRPEHTSLVPVWTVTDTSKKEKCP